MTIKRSMKRQLRFLRRTGWKKMTRPCHLVMQPNKVFSLEVVRFLCPLEDSALTKDSPGDGSCSICRRKIWVNLRVVKVARLTFWGMVGSSASENGTWSFHLFQLA